VTRPTDVPDPHEPASFSEMLGTSEMETGEGWSRVRMPIGPRHLQAAGNVQGGIIMTLADMAITRALSTLTQGNGPSVTVELKINFIAPARQGELIAEGRIIHKGGTLSVGEVSVTDADGKLIATGMGTWMVLQPRPR
jgi:uncharacterized protein (TIGR00369 family)